MFKFAILAVVAAVPVQCDRAAGAPPVPTRPPCQGDVIYVVDDAPVTCDLVPPQQLHVLLTGPDFQTRCDDMGGVVVFVDAVSAQCGPVDY